jgi:hypothetical protein
MKYYSQTWFPQEFNCCCYKHSADTHFWIQSAGANYLILNASILRSADLRFAATEPFSIWAEQFLYPLILHFTYYAVLFSGGAQTVSCCGGVGWPGCGNLSTSWFEFYFITPPISDYSIVCNVNTATSSNLTLLLRHPRPAQGKHPEAAPSSSPPPLWNTASGLFSHPNPSNHTLWHCILHTAFSHFLTLFLSCFRTLDQDPIFIPPICSTSTWTTNPSKEPTSWDYYPSTL